MKKKIETICQLGLEEQRLFNAAIRLFLGNIATQKPRKSQLISCYVELADSYGKRREWLQKLIKKIEKLVATDLDVSESQRAILMRDLDRLKDILKNKRKSESMFLDGILLFCGHLLGFVSSARGAICYSLVSWQNKGQHFTEQALLCGDVLQATRKESNEVKDAISVRGQIIKELREKGFDDYKIALVLNISEYQVKKIARELQRRD